MNALIPTPRFDALSEKMKREGHTMKEGFAAVSLLARTLERELAELLTTGKILVELEARCLNECRRLREQNEQMLHALRFYADPYRYMGANRDVREPDTYTPPDAPYSLDVTRDVGKIARDALDKVGA